MGFFSPWFLGGLFALGLPVYLHLLRQHRSEPLPFSSTMFLERRTQSSILHRRLKYIALMCMRLALLALLALLFANPYINRKVTAAGDGRKLVVFAIDNSFSMRANGDLDRAKSEATRALSKVGAADQAQVLAFGSQTQAMSQTTADPAELRAAIQSIQLSDSRSSYGELSQALRAMAKERNRMIEAHIFSDMQKSSMPSPFAELAVPSNVRLVLHPVGPRTDQPNWYIESVSAPGAVYRSAKTRIQATVAGANTAAAGLTASLALNGRVLDTKQINVPPNGRTALEFSLDDVPFGLNRGEIRIAGNDALPADDRFPFAIERKDPGRVLFVHDTRNGRAVLYVTSALESSPESAFGIDPAGAEQVANVSPERYAFVILSDISSLAPQVEENLNNFVNRGGSVLIALGPASATRSSVPVAGNAILGARYSTTEGDRFQTVASTDSSHPALQQLNNFEGVRFFQAVRVDPSNSRVLARLTDQTPLVLEKKMGEGRVLIFTSTFDNVSNDLPLHASFVPFIEQAATYLSGYSQSPSAYPVDSFADLRSAKDQGASVEVIDPDGKRALSLKEATTAQSVKLTREGFYEIRRANGRQNLIAVHADRRESNLSAIPAESITLWQNLGAGSPDNNSNAPGQTGQTERPTSLWWYFLLALLIMAVTEVVFSSRYLESAEDQKLVKKQAA